MTTESCGECRFFLVDETPQAKQGCCRRFPPVVVMSKGEAVSYFSRMQTIGWCGEWQPMIVH